MNSFLDNIKKQLPTTIPFDLKCNNDLLMPFEANIRITDWHITVEIRTELKDRVDNGALCNLIYTLVKHEEGHWTICPFDVQDSLAIRASVIRACKQILGNEMTKQKAGEEFCHLVVNMFADFVVDKVSISRDSYYKSGMGTIHDIVSEELMKFINNKKLYKLYELIFAVRESFLLDKKVEDLTNDEKKDIQDVLKTLEGNLAERLVWPGISYKFAKKIFSIISPYLEPGGTPAPGARQRQKQEKSDQEQADSEDTPEGSDNTPQTASMDNDIIVNGESRLTSSSSSIVEEIQSAKEILTSESIQEKMLRNDDAHKEREIKEYYRRKEEKARNTGAVEISKGWSPLTDENEALDIFFESKTEDLKLEYHEEKATAFPVAYVGKRKLSDGEPLQISRIKWSATRIFKRGDDVSINLYEKTTPINRETGEDVDKTILDIALILDSSSSMGSVYNRKSHFFILVTAIYSLLKHLKETGKDIYMNYSVINFSSNTWYSGWKEYRELKELKRNFILKQQSGGTVLKPEAIETMTSESKGPFLSIMVTDGKLSNIAAVVKAIDTLISKGNEFCLMQIGDAGGEFIEGIERVRGDVYAIKQVSDLSGLILKQGRKYWKST